MAEAKKVIEVGEVGSQVTELLGAHRQSILVYLAIFIPLSVIASYLDDAFGFISSDGLGDDSWNNDNGPFGVLALLASVYGQLWLFCRMAGNLGEQGLPSLGRYLPFVGMAILTWLGVGFATILLIVPGLIVASRWLMSPAIYTHEGRGAIESMGESWERTRGNTGKVMLVVLILVMVLVLISLAAAAVFSIFGSANLEYLTNGVVGELATVILIGTSVALYRLQSTRVEELGEVFE